MRTSTAFFTFFFPPISLSFEAPKTSGVNKCKHSRKTAQTRPEKKKAKNSDFCHKTGDKKKSEYLAPDCIGIRWSSRILLWHYVKIRSHRMWFRPLQPTWNSYVIVNYDGNYNCLFIFMYLIGSRISSTYLTCGTTWKLKNQPSFKIPKYASHYQSTLGHFNLLFIFQAVLTKVCRLDRF